ncbi:hypothetical protein P255_00025 [Acinetobacter brisouii CIP 110357]|uniref:Uncharacterized protein n=1 Tax=Acinetobacter brisouii CIP 110357 TaxID=1341683 RepID=V2USF1_9GAMM|nr:hypothetical protein F954_00249 [Acinetobacter brisouii ANC 4119]ESK52922.1 hypothetical protein P255_00025 [Acinetobacter brisouii CIP 110357]
MYLYDLNNLFRRSLHDVSHVMLISHFLGKVTVPIPQRKISF